MTKSATISARIDPKLKQETEAILSELGLTTTQAITLFFKQVNLRQGLPFAVVVPEPDQPSRADEARPAAV